MGYSEYTCEICSVSFAIGRIRTPNEPPGAGWDNYGFGKGGFVRSITDQKPAACMVAIRPPKDEDEVSETPLDLPPSLHPVEEMYFENIHDNPEEHQTKIAERLKSLKKKRSDRDEHIASADCRNWHGYNGHNISVEEMRGCTTTQGLACKMSDWQPEDDDEDFEKSGRYFLSGLIDSLTNVDNLFIEEVYPKRHGCAEICPAWDFTDLRQGSDDEDAHYAIAVHPTCLEVFKRATLSRYGHAEIHSFTTWWELDLEQKSLPPGWEHDGVEASQDQWWNHLVKFEYLAANPCAVPSLDMAFTPSVGTDPVGGYPEQNSRHHDIFSRVPLEICVLIFDHLSVESISILQLASPYLYRSSQNELHRRIVKEWPWLWEAWTDLPYSKWASFTAKELRDSIESPVKQVFVPTTVNWGSTVRVISKMRARDQLKGLRNRHRIWTICNKILDKVDELSHTGLATQP